MFVFQLKKHQFSTKYIFTRRFFLLFDTFLKCVKMCTNASVNVINNTTAYLNTYANTSTPTRPHPTVRWHVLCVIQWNVLKIMPNIFSKWKEICAISVWIYTTITQSHEHFFRTCGFYCVTHTKFKCWNTCDICCVDIYLKHMRTFTSISFSKMLTCLSDTHAHVAVSLSLIEIYFWSTKFSFFLRCYCCCCLIDSNGWVSEREGEGIICVYLKLPYFYFIIST